MMCSPPRGPPAPTPPRPCFAQRQSLSVSVRLGELEEVEREESRDIGLRVFVGKQSATVSGSDISAEGRAKLIDRAVAMARLAPEDPYAALGARRAPGARTASGTWTSTIRPSPRPRPWRPRPARPRPPPAPSTGVTNSDGGSSSWSASTWRLVTAAKAFRACIEASGLRRLGLGHRRRGRGHGARRRGPLDPPRRRPAPRPPPSARKAGQQAVAKLNPRKLDSTTAPVIFENRLAMSLLSPLIGAISGPSIARGTSFLKDRLGHAIFAKGVNLLDDPFRMRGLGSAPFDDEGVACEARALIDDGVLTTWLMNVSSAKQLGLESTGHASRGLAGPSGVSTHNLTLQPGDKRSGRPDGRRRDGPAGHLDVRPLAERQHRRLVGGLLGLLVRERRSRPVRSPRSPWPAT